MVPQKVLATFTGIITTEEEEIHEEQMRELNYRLTPRVAKLGEQGSL